MNLQKIVALNVFLTCAAKADFIVAPGDRAFQSGSDRVGGGFTNPGFHQSEYSAQNFSEPVVINGLAFRMDEGSGGLSLESFIPKVTIRLSTYTGTLASFNPSSYEANKGGSEWKPVDDRMGFAAVGSVGWAIAEPAS